MMTSTTPLPDRMFWEARGYYAFPLTSADEKLDDFAEWQVYASHVEAAKAGRFDTIKHLLDIYDRDAHWVRRAAYIKLMGDAGPNALAERIHQHLLAGLPADYTWDFAQLLFYWGRLDVVPTLIEGWRAGYVYQDAAYIPPRLSLLLEPEMRSFMDFPDEKSSAEEADAFRQEMLDRHAELRDSLGEHAFVFRGRLLNIEWIIRCALADLATGELDPEMRHKIEAMTGIDCSCFYRDEWWLQPLAAAALLEDMLASLDLFPFTPGQRYFFGHPVP